MPIQHFVFAISGHGNIYTSYNVRITDVCVWIPYIYSDRVTLLRNIDRLLEIS